MANLLIAARNLTRNRRRALTALLTVSIAVIAMVLADGFVQWIFWAMREGTIQSQLGHIQVVRPGYHSAGAADPFAYIIPENAPERQAIEQTPGVKLAAPRLTVTGLISHGETTVSFVADGVDPAKEAELSKAFRIVNGHNLSGAQAQEVVLGRGLARNLGVEPGATVALLATTASGGINAIEAKVAGIFISANQAYDDSALRLPIGLAQSLLRVNGAHMWLVLLEKTESTDGFLAQFRARFPEKSHHLEFVPWYERADFYNKTVASVLPADECAARHHRRHHRAEHFQHAGHECAGTHRRDRHLAGGRLQAQKDPATFRDRGPAARTDWRRSRVC